MKLSRKVHEAQVRIRVTHEPTLESGPSLEESTDIYCSTKIVFTQAEQKQMIEVGRSLGNTVCRAQPNVI